VRPFSYLSPWSSSLGRRPADICLRSSRWERTALDPVTGVDSHCNELELMSCFASGCAIVVLVKRLWIVIHTAHWSRPQSWGACIEPSPYPTLWISEQTAVHKKDGLGVVGHHNPGHRGLAAPPRARRSSCSSKNLTITTLGPIPSAYLPK